MEEEMAVVRNKKKELKKDVGRVGWGLILYTALTMLIVFVDTIWRSLYLTIKNGGVMPSEEALMEITEGGMSMLLGVLLGVLFLILFSWKKAPVKEMFAQRKRMTVRAFLKLLAVFMGMQLVFSYAAELLEMGLNLFGYSVMESIEEATGISMTFSMFVYAAFVGPCAEEFVFRGVVIQSLKKYGKMFVIVLSSVLFGVMHGNLPQSMFAFSVGLVLAYTAVEYSLLWSVVLHIANNFVFAELMTRAGELLGETAGMILSGVVVLGFFVAAIVILWQNRSRIKEYIEENRAEKGVYRAAFTTVPMILFIGFHLLVAVMMIQKLP